MTTRHRDPARWIYAVALVVYGFPLLMTTAHLVGEASAPQGWLYLLPLIPLIVQLVRPTIVGWWVAIVPLLVYAGSYGFYLIRNVFERQWSWDPSGFAMGSVLFVMFVLVLYGLVRMRPRGVRDDGESEIAG